MIRASIIGASGYTGGEVLRLLLAHKDVEVKQITSEKNRGEYAHRIHPNLRGFTRLQFISATEINTDCDVVFLSLPHGKSMEFVNKLIETGVKIIDLSADFRLHNPLDYPKWYGYEHRYPALLSKAAYGIPELHREEIRGAGLVACAGCLATASILALSPLVADGLIDPGRIVIDAKIGSSAAGRSPKLSTHHPERAGVVRSYSPTGHRHIAEIEQELGRLAKKELKVSFSPHGVEMVRGILVTAHAFTGEQLPDIEIWKTFRSFYKDSPFIRFVKEKTGVYRYPEPKIVAGTNFCDIGFETDAHVPRVVVMSAIDNLVKGGGGQAVQCMNIMFNLDEKAGLWSSGLHPV